MKKSKAARAFEYLDEKLILSAMDESELGTEKAHFELKRRKNMKLNTIWKKWTAVAAAFAIVLSTGFIALGLTSNGATIALDVNPSIEIEVNRKEEVKEIKALNEDAKIVLGELDFEGVDLDVALYAIIGSMMDKGYLTAEKNSILISVDTKNGAKATELKDRISGKVDSILADKSIDASVMTQTFDKNKDTNKKADENEISPAKAELISKIVKAELLDAHGVPYTYEVLAGLNVNELKLILESKSVKLEGVESNGTASSKQYISREDAIAKALADAGFAQNEVFDLDVEMDYDKSAREMVYEVEFEVGENEYDYELSAISGEILDKQIKPADKNDEKDDMPPTEECISRTQALEIAYSHAGVAAENVRRPEIEFDRENGKQVYEIEFKLGQNEYEYTIDAVTGEILESEVEKDD